MPRTSRCSRGLAALFAVFAVLALSACSAVHVESSGDGTFDLGGGKYLVRDTAFWPLLGVDSMRAQARRDAEAYCAKHGGRFAELEDRSRGGAEPPVGEIVFECR